MKSADFKTWMGQLPKLSRHQQEQVKQRLNQRLPPSAVVDVLEQANRPCCPVCQVEQPYRWGYQAGLQRFRCRACGRTYTTLSGTPLAGLRPKEQWLNYSEALLQGLTIRASARQCGVEADETFFPYSCKGQRHLNRPPRQRGKQIHARGTGPDPVPVLVVRDRSGATADFKLAAADSESIRPPLGAILVKDAILCRDGNRVYRSVARQLGITHRPINLAAGIRVIAEVYHVPNVNAYDSRLKQWRQRFHGVATQYLENYLGWRRWLERWGERNSPIIGLNAALGRQNQFQLVIQT